MLIACLALHYAIGGRIRDLSLGVVNNELRSYEDCSNISLTTVKRQGFDCLLEKVSCRFIDAIDADTATTVSISGFNMCKD